MQPPRKYLAAPVPRHIRQSRLGYLPTSCIIGTRTAKGDKGANHNFDIVMLPEQQFQRMKNGVSLQHVVAPTLQIGPTFNASFIMTDIRHVTVPAEEPDPEAYARHHFLLEFGLIEPQKSD